jgi:glutamate/tyrosine decarboxylase-like PLP-dependent enzyme
MGEPMSDQELLERAASHAIRFLDALDDRHVAPRAGLDELRAALALPLPEEGVDPGTVLDDLARDVDAGLLGSAGGRFFGWVMGGTVPAAVAADWLTSTWDQNGAIVATSPAAAVVEEVCGTWLRELLGLPPSASFALVTGCQMAHVTGLAAARQRLLADRGIDVQRHGLAGAPRLRVLASELRHETIDRAVRLLGIGTDAIVAIPADDVRGIDLALLEQALDVEPSAPTVVCLQAGELNTGAFDAFGEASDLAHARGAWVHVDGAFGLWAGASERYRQLVAGIARCDSWATDGHKWLNVPFDCGFSFVADRASHRASLTASASYFEHADGGRDAVDWNPEWSRRARGFAVYAGIRSLGRTGVADLVERCCRHARTLVAEIGALPGAEVVAEPVVNQGLVRFTSPAGDDDRLTDEVIARIQEGGVAWFGGTTWRGRRVMRISVCNWRTSDDDVQRTIQAVGAALAGATAAPAAAT